MKNKYALLFVGVVALVVLMTWLRPHDTSRPAATTSAAESPSARSSKHAYTGETARLVYEGKSSNTDIPVAISEEAYDAMNKAVAAHDSVGLQELVLKGDIFTVPNQTRVLVLDPGFFKDRVRIQDPGAGFDGKAVYVAHEWVRAE